MTTAYRPTSKQLARIAKHPEVSAAFANEKRLWEGCKVAVYYRHQRGNRRRYTDYRIVYGTLVLAPNGTPDQIGVRDVDGEVYVIHVGRATRVINLSREKSW